MYAAAAVWESPRGRPASLRPKASLMSQVGNRPGTAEASPESSAGDGRIAKIELHCNQLGIGFLKEHIEEGRLRSRQQFELFHMGDD